MAERYEIRVLGLLGPLLRTVFGSMRCEAVPRQTTLRGQLSLDELGWLLKRLDQWDVELICIACPAPNAGRQAVHSRPGSSP